MVSGGLKFHCWRTISRNELPPSEDQRKTNSCVLAVSFSSNTSDISFCLCGWSKISRIVWIPVLRRANPVLPRKRRQIRPVVFFLRGDLNHGCPLNIQPAFAGGSNSPLRWGNKPFAHTQ